eukprot:Plantae.Rhodophyta-Hildenbrandia_rubra.ctg7089.p1 GENE.Plantae.Rhodophyta-Hildenbrandia_rubra.ctg7089~~Plantae.Rhodophyta-Hildenbrandia_rubra.ctg7089.p1  ORF type:complete len:458 (+),score=88.20 Plantae.Rhodophyta-Hildenbrandia_rubra.ctg7089:3487-4860(+)
MNPRPSHTHSSLSWSLASRVTNSTNSLLSASSIEALDDLELAVRLGQASLSSYLSSSETVAQVSQALVEAVGVLSGRKELLRASWLFGKVVKVASREAVLDGVKNVEDGLGKMVGIVVERISDREMSETAGTAVSTALGWRELDDLSAKWVGECSRRLVDTLITEVSLTKNLWALDCLGLLLKRDGVRIVFCERDGLTTLVEVLRAGGDDREEVYKTVFAVWMLSFAGSDNAKKVVLSYALSSRLIMALLSLLDDLRKQRLKVVRVTLATLRNLSKEDESNSKLCTEFRQEMVSMGMKNVLEKMFSVVGSLWCSDMEAGLDAEFLKETLAKEEDAMSSFDKYAAEVRSGALHQSSMHRDDNFFLVNAEKFVSTHRDIILSLAKMTSIKTNFSDEERVIACSDLEKIIESGPIPRSICLKLPNLKANLLYLMTSAENLELRQASLACVQRLLMKPRQR